MSMFELSELGNKKKVITTFLLLTVLAAAGIYYTHFYQRQANLADARGSLTTTGTIEAKTVMTSFKVAGRIQALLVDEGSAVEKGQELAVLESREIEAKIAQAKGANQAAEGQAQVAEKAISLTQQTVDAKIEQAEAALTNAKQKYQRAESLHASEAISNSQLDEATNNLQAAQGQLNEALAGRLQVEVARNQYAAAVGLNQQTQGAQQETQVYLDNTHLKAPISGFITQKTLEEGEMLSAGTPGR